MQSLLQRVVGYCLTDLTREHALFFFYGTGANGKSVFLSTIGGILGGYAKTAPTSTFTATGSEQHLGLAKGGALWALGRKQEAIDSCDRALEIDSRLANACFNKGWALCELGHHDEAIVCNERALEIDPGNARAWYNKGNALWA